MPIGLLSRISPRIARLVIFAVIAGALARLVYYLTAFRTVTWWENSEMALAAITLGIPFPPGCLLGVLSGWLVSHVGVWWGSPAFALNLFAGAAATVTVLMIVIISASTLRRVGHPTFLTEGKPDLTAICIGAASGALILAFSDTFWQYAVQFTPYIFTALFTALIVWAMLKWWGHAGDGKSPVWLFVAALLFGLDLSVHRTNALLGPALIIWMLLRRPRAFLSPSIWLAGIFGLALGSAAQLIQIPMAAAGPYINAGDPATFDRLWNYVALKQLGTGWLTLFPRNAPFWDVQMADYLQAFGASFFSSNGPLSIIGLVPGLLGLFGLATLWKQKPRLAAGLLVLFIFTSLGAVIYFNIPGGFFRSLHRHYLPSFVIFSVLITYGAGNLLKTAVWAGRRFRVVTVGLVGLLLALMPLQQLIRNYAAVDGSRNYFTYDFAHNLLTSLAPDAIVVTFGDNDTFPLWYLHRVMGIRPDVAILNTSLLNLPWYIRHIQSIYPNLPIDLSLEAIDSLNVRPWRDTVIALPVAASPRQFDLPDTVRFPDSITFTAAPTVGNQHILAQDWMILHMVEQNHWRRPFYFANTGGGGVMSLLQPYLRFEGMVWRVVPSAEAASDITVLRRNLLEKYSYRGYADRDVRIDDVSANFGRNYLGSFMHLAAALADRGDTAGVNEVRAKLTQSLPPDRLEPLSPSLKQALDQYLPPERR